MIYILWNYFSSFANYLLVSKFSEEEIWKKLKNIKSGITFDKKCLGVDGLGPLYEDSADHKTIMEEVERQLEIDSANSIVYEEQTGYFSITSSPAILSSMTDAKLKTAAEMYLYILSCPGRLLPWFMFYSDLFQKKPPNQIVLTLNRILKHDSTPENQGLQTIAEKLFNVMASNSSFKYQEIQRITQGSSTKQIDNISSDDLKLKGFIDICTKTF